MALYLSLVRGFWVHSREWEGSFEDLTLSDMRLYTANARMMCKHGGRD